MQPSCCCSHTFCHQYMLTWKQLYSSTSRNLCIICVQLRLKPGCQLLICAFPAAQVNVLCDTPAHQAYVTPSSTNGNCHCRWSLVICNCCRTGETKTSCVLRCVCIHVSWLRPEPPSMACPDPQQCMARHTCFLGSIQPSILPGQPH